MTIKATFELDDSLDTTGKATCSVEYTEALPVVSRLYCNESLDESDGCIP